MDEKEGDGLRANHPVPIHDDPVLNWTASGQVETIRLFLCLLTNIIIRGRESRHGLTCHEIAAGETHNCRKCIMRFLFAAHLDQHGIQPDNQTIFPTIVGNKLCGSSWLPNPTLVDSDPLSITHGRHSSIGRGAGGGGGTSGGSSVAVAISSDFKKSQFPSILHCTLHRARSVQVP